MPVEVSLSSIHNIQMHSSPIKFAKVYQLTVKLFKQFIKKECCFLGIRT